jgi:PAS domain S-box-containing protein
LVETAPGPGREAAPIVDGSLGAPNLGGANEHVAAAALEAGDGITVQDATGRLTFVNRAAALLMGFSSPEEAMNEPIGRVMDRFDLLDERGRTMPLSRLPSRRALRLPGRHESTLRFRVKATGEERYAATSAVSLRDASGAVRYVVNTFQDVTALKRLDARLQLLADAGTILARSGDYQETLNELAQLMVRRLADWCVVDVLDPESGVTRVAVAHARKEKVLLAADLQRRYPTDPSEGATATVIRTGVPLLLPVITDSQLEEAARDGEHAAGLRALGLRSVLIVPLAARGTTMGALTLIRSDEQRPFSERDVPLAQEVARRAGTAVDAARLLHEATEALRLRDDFLAMASHDMRTPLAAILGYVQLAARRMKRLPIEDTKLSGYLASAERMTGRLNGLVGELMDVSLLRSGRALPLSPERLRLRTRVEEIVAEHRRLVTDHTFDVVAMGDPEIEADGDRLERVMDNLINNAAKYSEDGSRIRVIVEASDGEATISVTDTGRGIPAGDLPHIFEPFHRAANAGGIRGTGLGLAGSRDVVRQMGGDITVTSEEGVGSTFVVHLPCEVHPPAAT